MNNSLKKFCETELFALSLYKNRRNFNSKDEIYDLVREKFPRNRAFILLAVEAAAECWNFHHESGPWMRDLKEKAGFFTADDLKAMRIFVKYS